MTLCVICELKPKAVTWLTVVFSFFLLFFFFLIINNNSEKDGLKIQDEKCDSLNSDLQFGARFKNYPRYVLHQQGSDCFYSQRKERHMYFCGGLISENINKLRKRGCIAFFCSKLMLSQEISTT